MKKKIVRLYNLSNSIQTIYFFDILLKIQILFSDKQCLQKYITITVELRDFNKFFLQYKKLLLLILQKDITNIFETKNFKKKNNITILACYS